MCCFYNLEGNGGLEPPSLLVCYRCKPHAARHPCKFPMLLPALCL
nr:MAG TPA: hypothetical protein [Caudoviricetes sp.]